MDPTEGCPHGHGEEVDLFVVAVDEVNLVHRSDNERSTSSPWPRGQPLVGSIDEDEVHQPCRCRFGNVVAVDEIDIVIATVDEVDLVALLLVTRL